MAKKKSNGVVATKSDRNGQVVWDVTGLLVCRVKPDTSLKVKDDKARVIALAINEFGKINGTGTVVVDMSSGMVVAELVNTKDGKSVVGDVRAYFKNGAKPVAEKKVAKKVPRKASKSPTTKRVTKKATTKKKAKRTAKG